MSSNYWYFCSYATAQSLLRFSVPRLVLLSVNTPEYTEKNLSASTLLAEIQILLQLRLLPRNLSVLPSSTSELQRRLDFHFQPGGFSTPENQAGSRVQEPLPRMECFSLTAEWFLH